VYFDPLYVGGYGWLFPKGDSANVGVGVNRLRGGDPALALEHLLTRLHIEPGSILGRTGGPIPCGGRANPLVRGPDVLVGDAAGLTHPVTGAGILPAVVSGAQAGRAAASAALANDPSHLSQYEAAWDSYLGGPMRHALDRHREMDARWTTDPDALSTVIRENWIAFKAYGRRRTQR
jgi:flavin-dependent dehydrogenase